MKLHNFPNKLFSNIKYVLSQSCSGHQMQIRSDSTYLPLDLNLGIHSTHCDRYYKKAHIMIR